MANAETVARRAGNILFRGPGSPRAKAPSGFAMTNGVRVLPPYLGDLERAGLGDVDVIIRMAGCPNSCSRPPTAEIGILGYGKNDYVLMVGGARDGSRLARVLYPRLGEVELIEALKNLVKAIRDRNPRHLPAGDYPDKTPARALKANKPDRALKAKGLPRSRRLFPLW